MSPCPPGLVPCLVTPQCGARYVGNPSLDDGISTPGAYPWQVYIENQTGFTGSGVLLDQLHVLTAAHKVDLNIATPSNIKIRLGVWDPSVLIGNEFRTAVNITYPSSGGFAYNRSILRDDVAIIRLNASVNFRVNINTVCLPNLGESFVGRNCVVSGWGQSQFSVTDSPFRPQKQVTVPVVTYEECRRSMSQFLGTAVDTYLTVSGNICAGGQKDKDACTNDGGGPLMCLNPATNRYTLAGLVLWGKGCGTTGVYGVYANVSTYKNWIDSTIAALNAG